MSKIAINFFTEDLTYTLKHKTKIRQWLFSAIVAEGYALEELNFILCSDEYLLVINKQYLDHDTYTDVITFDNSDVAKSIAGDIFISLERVQENSRLYKSNTFDELCRIMIHGTLHLLGYKDKSKHDKIAMTAKEDHYLAQIKK